MDNNILGEKMRVNDKIKQNGAIIALQLFYLSIYVLVSLPLTVSVDTYL